MSNKIYTSVPVPRFPRNVFSLSRPVVGSMRMQRLYPTEILEIFPGDAFNVRQETFLRTAPLVAPPLAKVTLQHHAFFVPCWQLHPSFDDFITGGEKMDFTDHMPYTVVGDIYQWIDGLLSAQVNTIVADNFADALAYFKSNKLIEDVVSMIESFDYSRAIPFSLPEFNVIQGVNSDGDIVKLEDLSIGDFTDEAAMVAEMKAFAQGNLEAWRKYNPVSLATSTIRVNILPFAAQVKIWNEYFRDENLCDDIWEEYKESNIYAALDRVELGLDDWSSNMNPDDFDSSMIDEWEFLVRFFSVKKRAWKKDRFTSALPWTQKGPDVVIPLAGTIPVSVDTLSPTPTANAAIMGSKDTSKMYYQNTVVNASIKGSGSLSEASDMATMRDLRRAEALEESFEADGRFGNRYPENTLGQFGVYTPDSRLPRCQFLGSSSQVVSFGEIPQTSETGDTPLGTLAGKGTSYSPNFLFKRRFTMHGFVIIFTSIRVSALYEQGIHPMFSRFDRTEYAWPRFARLGEEPIYAKELSIFGDGVEEDSVFGYAPRYSTYKSDTGSIHGQMKTTLSYWTFSRKFPIDKAPALSDEFIYNDPRRDAFAITNPFAECFYMELDWKVRASRLLPFYGVSSI